MTRPHIPTTAEWDAMSWHARARLLGLKARTLQRPDTTTKATAQHILNGITPDDPAVVEARRQLLDTMYGGVHR